MSIIFNGQLDSSRFLKLPDSPAEEFRPQTISRILDVENGFLYTLLTYPLTPAKSDRLIIEGSGGSDLVICGDAAKEIWAAMGMQKPARYRKLSNAYGYPDQEQIFDLDKAVLYTYDPNRLASVRLPGGGSTINIPVQAIACWKSLMERCGS